MDMFIPSKSLFRRRALVFALTFAFAALISIGAPGRARAGITDAVKTETLPNGLKVLVLENHKMLAGRLAPLDAPGRVLGLFLHGIGIHPQPGGDGHE